MVDSASIPSFLLSLTGDKNGSIRAWSTSLNSFPMVTQFLGVFDNATYMIVTSNMGNLLVVIIKINQSTI